MLSQTVSSGPHFSLARGQSQCSTELLEEDGKSKRSHGRWVQLGGRAWGLLTLLSSLQAPELLEN